MATPVYLTFLKCQILGETPKPVSLVLFLALRFILLYLHTAWWWSVMWQFKALEWPIKPTTEGCFSNITATLKYKLKYKPTVFN